MYLEKDKLASLRSASFQIKLLISQDFSILNMKLNSQRKHKYFNFMFNPTRQNYNYLENICAQRMMVIIWGRNFLKATSDYFSRPDFDSNSKFN